MISTKKSSKNLKKDTILIGAHMSISNGLYKSLERGASIGCNAIQIFTHSNRQWSIKDIPFEQIDKFKDVRKKLNIKDIIVHSSYLVNLGSENKETQIKSINTLLKELEQCSSLDIPYLVVHTGSGYKENPKICLNQIINNLNLILDETTNNNTTILLENMAGQGSSVGKTLDQLNYILKNIKQKDKIGICFDTCHAWASGYNFSNEPKYKAFWSEFNKKIGLNNLKVIHLNDSKTKLNSYVDRHAKIGKGTIGMEAFKLIMNDDNLKKIPKILEVPVDDYKEYGLEIEKLINLMK